MPPDFGGQASVSIPPLALALKDRPGPESRGTLSCVGFLSVMMSTTALILRHL